MFLLEAVVSFSEEEIETKSEEGHACWRRQREKEEKEQEEEERKKTKEQERLQEPLVQQQAISGSS